MNLNSLTYLEVSQIVDDTRQERVFAGRDSHVGHHVTERWQHHGSWFFQLNKCRIEFQKRMTQSFLTFHHRNYCYKLRSLWWVSAVTMTWSFIDPMITMITGPNISNRLINCVWADTWMQWPFSSFVSSMQQSEIIYLANSIRLEYNKTDFLKK